MRTHVEATNAAVKTGTYNKGNVVKVASVACRRSAPATTPPKLTERRHPVKAREIRKLKRAAEHRERKQYAQRINRAFTRLSEGCSERTAKAVNPIDLTELADYRGQMEMHADKIERRNRRIWYKDDNPLGNKIHAVQKMRGKSMSLI